MYIGTIPGLSMGVTTEVDASNYEIHVLDLSLVSLALSFFSMVRMFIAAFEVVILGGEEPTIKEEIKSSLTWGHLVVVSSFSRIMGMILICAYPEIGLKNIRYFIAIIWFLGNILISYR